MSNYIIEQLDEIDPVRCPCGATRRAFISPDNPTVSQHLVDIASDSRVHYHKKITETYFILEGTGQMELDGELIDVKPGMGILIKPLCRHRAVGKLRVLVTVIPPHDPGDEWFD